MKPIKIYWHVNELSNWQHRLDQQYQLMKSTGLATAADQIVLCGNGQPWTFVNWISEQNDSKLTYAEVNPNAAYWEYPTINFLHQQAVSNTADYAVLYLHLKGTTRPGDPNIESWVKFLHWAVIERWTDCVAALETTDCAGPNWETTPWPHFSGNFWWANSSYLRKLPAPQHPDVALRTGQTQFATHYPGGEPYWRFDYEAWIGSGNPVITEIAKSFPEGGRHYREPYPESNYRK